MPLGSVVEVGIDPHSVEKKPAKFDQLALLLGVSPTEIHRPRKADRRSGSDGKNLRGKVGEAKRRSRGRRLSGNQKLEIKGVYGNFKHSRLYPNKNLASHLLGFVNKEDCGDGCGESCRLLFKRTGWLAQSEKTVNAKMPQHRSLEVAARDGLSVELEYRQDDSGHG